MSMIIDRDTTASSSSGSPGISSFLRCLYTWLVVSVVLSQMAVPLAFAKCPCTGGGGENWDASGFIGSALGSDTGFSASSTDSGQIVDRSRFFSQGELLSIPKSVTQSDLIVCASVLSVDSGVGSNGSKSADDLFIAGSILFPASDLLNDSGDLRPLSEIVGLLGAAGISPEDRAVVYADTLSDATLVLWAMEYAGQKNVSLLDGGFAGWKAAGLSVSGKSETKNRSIYSAHPREKLLAGYSLLSEEGVQVVDTRAVQEYGVGRIRDAILLEDGEVVSEGRIADEKVLNKTFERLNRDQPVVVYSSDPGEAAVVWYALQLMGYDSRLYTWQDWLANRPEENSSSNGRFTKLSSY